MCALVTLVTEKLYGSTSCKFVQVEKKKKKKILSSRLVAEPEDFSISVVVTFQWFISSLIKKEN